MPCRTERAREVPRQHPLMNSIGIAITVALFCSLAVTALPTASAVTAVNISIPSGAGSPESGWTTGSTTLDGWSPLSVTLIIGVNNSVLWTNNDAAPHTVTIHPGDPTSSSGASTTNEVATSGNMNAGATYTYTFNAPGTYTITCDYHPWMIGTVIVKAAASTSQSSSTVPEFPAGSLAAILLVVLAVAALLSGRVFRKTRSGNMLILARLMWHRV